MKKPCTKKDAPAKQHGIWREILQAQECGRSYVLKPIEANVMPAPTSNRPEEHEYKIGFVYLKILVRWELGSEHAVKFSKGTWHPIKIREKKAPASKSSEKREIVVDFRASMHMMSKKKLVQMNWIFFEGPGTPLWCLQPTTKCIKTRKHKFSCVHDLNLFATVQSFQEPPVFPSFGNLCKDHGYFHECVTGQKPL